MKICINDLVWGLSINNITYLLTYLFKKPANSWGVETQATSPQIRIIFYVMTILFNFCKILEDTFDSKYFYFFPKPCFSVETKLNAFTLTGK